MMVWSPFFRIALLASVCLLQSGCLPSGQSQMDEQKEPHFLAGKSRVNSLDYKGAIESFERALEVNPGSASAHFELGWLFDQKDPDPAAAIYHYDRYLKLHPRADNAETIRTRILACKQELARTVSLGPLNQTMQRQWEQLADENKRLRDELEVARRSPGQPAQPSPPQTAPSIAQSPRSDPPPQKSPARDSTEVASNRQTSQNTYSQKHTIKAGDTPTLIAKRYGVKVDMLMAANPGLDARHLRIGQALLIPPP
jgi:tetratricopeptide (TPR) repeat protein